MHLGSTRQSKKKTERELKGDEKGGRDAGIFRGGRKPFLWYSFLRTEDLPRLITCILDVEEIKRAHAVVSSAEYSLKFITGLYY
jgi:hypothetical protein